MFLSFASDLLIVLFLILCSKKCSDVLLLLSWCFTSTETVRTVGSVGTVGGGGGE